MAQIVQATPYLAKVLLVLSSDHRTGAVGKTPSVLISRGGAAAFAPGPAATEIGYGWYGIPLLPADTLTLGDLCYHCTAPGCDDADQRDQVIPAPPLLTIDSSLQTTNQLLGQLVAGLCPKR